MLRDRSRGPTDRSRSIPLEDRGQLRHAVVGLLDKIVEGKVHVRELRALRGNCGRRIRRSQLRRRQGVRLLNGRRLPHLWRGSRND